MAKTSLRSWMQNGKISHQFLLVFIPVISVILIALAAYNYTAQKSILLADIENFSTQVVEANAAYIGAKLHEQITELQRVAEGSKLQRMNWVEMKPRINQLNASKEHLYSHLLVLTPEGKTYETDSAEITDIKLETLTSKIFTQKLTNYIGKPFYSEQRNNWLIPIAVPILTDESLAVGALAAMIPLEKLSEVAGKINFNGKGYGWIVGEDGFVLAHPNPEVVTKLNVLESKAVGFTNLDVLGAEMLSQKSGIGEIIRPDGVEELLVYGSIPNSPGWTLGVAILKTEIYSEITDSLLVALFSFLVAILLLIGIMFVLVENKITKPIREIIDYVEQISEGKLYVVPNKVWNNELGNISAALQLMQENLKRIIGVVYKNANTIHSGSMEMNLNSQQVSQGANQQAVSLEEISSAMEETLVTIKQNTDHAIQTERISQMASANIQVVSSSMEKTLHSMNSIAKKINIINEFAEKTRMLAINASIEAARAGTAGRGFAVVAGEVRKLAESSQEAAQTIIELSEQMVSDASQSNSLLESVIPDIEKTAELVKEIMNGSNDQQIGAQQATSAIMQLNKVTQENAASSEELSANGEFFLVLAQTMKDAVSFFKMDNKDEKQTPTANENKSKQKSENRNEVTGIVKETKVNPTQKGISLEMHDTTDDDFEHL